jgi:1,2-phenylacetyl-CoA epoxidase catalytic subunit
MTQPQEQVNVTDTTAKLTELTVGVADLLGAIAYGELAAFEQLSRDSASAPNLAGRAALARMAAAEMAHYDLVADYLTRFGIDVEAAMQPYRTSFDAFHKIVVAKNWYESIIEAYVGDGLAADLYRELGNALDPETRDLINTVLADTGHADFAQREISAAVADDRILRDKLTLWCRRLLGEALTQAQYVVAERDDLATLMITAYGDMSGIAVLFKTLQQRHTKRMSALGLG